LTFAKGDGDDNGPAITCVGSSIVTTVGDRVADLSLIIPVEVVDGEELRLLAEGPYVSASVCFSVGATVGFSVSADVGYTVG